MPLPDVPFDERHFVLPNERGRVLTRDGEPLPGVYAVGWIKRGPTGILGTNKRDAEETVSCLVEDLGRGALPQPPAPGLEQIDGLLAERKPDLVTVEAGARSTATSSSAGATSCAHGSSWRPGTSSWPRPGLRPRTGQQLVPERTLGPGSAEAA